MARIRTIKPEFFTSEDICELTPLARLFYQACWCEADREGRMEWKPRTMKLRYFPADDCDIQEVADEVTERGLVILYEVDGKTYGCVPSFQKHQQINPREAASKLPDPDACRRVPTRADASNPDVHAQTGKEGKGKDTDPYGSSADEPRDHPGDLKSRIWGPALDWLVKHSGKPERSLRPLMGRWCRDYGDGAVLVAMQQAARAGPMDPVSWIIEVLEKGKKRGTGPDVGERIARDAEDIDRYFRVEPGDEPAGDGEPVLDFDGDYRRVA